MMKTVTDVLEKIDFVNRCSALSDRFSFRDDRLENYDNAKVKEIIKSFGYETVRYYKRENFFKVEEISKPNSYDIVFNISFKYGLCEFIWNAPWHQFLKLCNVDFANIKMPAFRSYDELHEILTIAFEMYEDYKRELIALYEAYGTVKQ